MLRWRNALIVGSAFVSAVAACEDYGGYALSSDCRRLGFSRCDAGALDYEDASSDMGAQEQSDAASDQSSDVVSDDAADGAVDGSFDAATNDSDAPHDAQLSDVSARIGSTAALFNEGLPGKPAAIYTCFTVKPHREWDGGRSCEKQQTRDQACNGEQFAGTSVDKLRQRVRNLIEDSWQRYAGLEFYPWPDCPVDANTQLTTAYAGTIQITFVSSCPKDRRGSFGNCLDPDFDPPPWNEVRGPVGKGGFPTDVHIDWKALRDGMIDRAVVHEFGHALGFGHARGAGSGAACFPESIDFQDSTALPLTAFFEFVDVESIMTPCPNALPPRAEALSAGDVLGIQSWYSRKPLGSLVGDNGQCASVARYTEPQPGDFAVGGFPCRGRLNDSWRRDDDSAAEQLKLEGDRGCLVMQAASGNATDWYAHKTACADDEAQRFASTGVEWRAMGNLCVTVQSAGLRTAFCDGSEAQKWDFFHDVANVGPGRIRATGTNKCVSRQTIASDVGEQLTLETCNAGDEKQHLRASRGHLMPVGATQALGIFVGGSTPVPGAKLSLNLMDQWASINSEFYLSGPLVVLGQCMSFLNPAAPDAAIGLRACGTGAAEQQVWDYYFGYP